ncbi:MAG: septum formation protein Maf [Saprospiraceae bacterium]|nr:septum formation protein Maf [Saprospiraceae bacterium]
MTTLPLLELPVILASASPRRKFLLEEAGFQVQVCPSSIDEYYPSELRIYDIPSYLAAAKAHAIEPGIHAEKILIAADTIVVLSGEVLGKPDDRGSAINMLKRLSGKMHEVYTGVCLINGEKQSVFTCRSEVTFAELTMSEIEYYVDLFNPMDKAGSYGIQEWLGWCKIEKINGSYSNIMGLPMEMVYKQLKDLVSGQV